MKKTTKKPVLTLEKAKAEIKALKCKLTKLNSQLKEWNYAHMKAYEAYQNSENERARESQLWHKQSMEWISVRSKMKEEYDHLSKMNKELADRFHSLQESYKCEVDGRENATKRLLDEINASLWVKIKRHFQRK